MTWSQAAWLAIEPVYQKILDLPFIKTLVDGTLEREKFLFYIAQDSLYLDDFAKSLAALAVKSRGFAQAGLLLGFAKEACEVERELHRSFLLDAPPLEPSPSCLLYTSYLYRQLATTSLETGLAAVLPCFWIYQRVGEHILAQPGVPGNPYQSWIDTYGGEEYARSVAGAVSLADELATAATPVAREEMTGSFVLASKMEWMFWDSAWRLEKWPV
ncbi:MAG: TenA family protein [Deltaproteobacteria bacterium]|jgi:thiaminase/transcriptional activator TenA|nr:TenA family protein [Deltaproteobacteria bacterium]